MTSVEIAGGPKFSEFEFEPGRRDNMDGRVSLDGLVIIFYSNATFKDLIFHYIVFQWQ